MPKYYQSDVTTPNWPVENVNHFGSKRYAMDETPQLELEGFFKKTNKKE